MASQSVSPDQMGVLVGGGPEWSAATPCKLQWKRYTVKPRGLEIKQIGSCTSLQIVHTHAPLPWFVFGRCIAGHGSGRSKCQQGTNDVLKREKRLNLCAIVTVTCPWFPRMLHDVELKRLPGSPGVLQNGRGQSALKNEGSLVLEQGWKMEVSRLTVQFLDWNETVRLVTAASCLTKTTDWVKPGKKGQLFHFS